jgi:hypothetical protein
MELPNDAALDRAPPTSEVSELMTANFHKRAHEEISKLTVSLIFGSSSADGDE